jgi:hypothetical protein
MSKLIEKALSQLKECDDEQVKMMEERVILTDYFDNVIGHGSKKESECLSLSPFSL